MVDLPESGQNGNPRGEFRIAHSRKVSAVVILLLVIHAGLLAYAATRHSPTLNEPGHLVAGISHWQYGRFDLYRVNPPLSHMVAALPVLATGAETDWGNFRDAPGARPEFVIGADFVKVNGERSLWLFTLARWACIPFSLLGGYICFRWARDLYGAASGLLALLLWCFSPNILAHAELVTPDMAATSLGVTAGYFFWHWLQRPTWTCTIIAGLILGLAELTKFTWVILYGLWPLLWFIWLLTHRKGDAAAHRWLVQGSQLALLLLLALYVLNLGYGFEGSGKQLGKFEFISSTLKAADAEKANASNRFTDTWMESLPVPVPENYLQGIDVQKRDFEDFGRPSYLRGEFQDRGWWYYYLYAAAIKIPLGTWALFLLSGLSCLAALRNITGTGLADLAVLLAPAIVVFTLVSSQTGFSHHFRYILPCFPFAFIWISQIAGSFATRSWMTTMTALAILWSTSSSLWIYPNSLSYFNELAGGPARGHEHLINSNIDWGQDLLNLKRWLADHPEAQPLGLVYYGYFDPADIGIPYVMPPTRMSLDLTPKDKRVDLLKPGWYAISVNYLKGYRWKYDAHAYSYFALLDPVAKAGESIYIYHLPEGGDRDFPPDTFDSQ